MSDRGLQKRRSLPPSGLMWLVEKNYVFTPLPDFSLIFPTLPRSSVNSATFPGYPRKQSHITKQTTAGFHRERESECGHAASTAKTQRNSSRDRTALQSAVQNATSDGSCVNAITLTNIQTGDQPMLRAVTNVYIFSFKFCPFQ